ncbi:hypothetical protein ACHAWF_004687 [Thalassiosira exigua]
MLDLVAFALTIAATNYVAKTNPILSSPASSSSDEASAVHRASSAAFRACLLTSLSLLSLSALEAAPAGWTTLVGDRPSSFVAWYRSLLRIQCSLLAIVHPSLLGVALSACLFPEGTRTRRASPGTNATTTPPSPGRNGADGTRRRNRPLILVLNVAAIATKCVLATALKLSWRLLLRAAGRIVPYRITRREGGGCGDAWYRQVRGCCTPGTALAASISLSLSLASLAAVGSLLLRSDVISGLEKDEWGDSSTLEFLSLKFMVSVLSAFGMMVASLLNGFGCASMPHSHLAGAFLEPVPPSVVAKAEEDLRYATGQLEEKCWMLSDVVHHARRDSLPSHTPCKSKISSDNTRAKQLREEVTYLQTLVGDMKDDVNEMKHSNRSALAARTTLGHFRWIVGVVFSVVLVVRVILAASSFLPALRKDGAGGDSPSRSDASDPLTSVLLWLLGRGAVSAERYDLLRQGTSLVLAGGLGASQARAFLRVTGALGRRLGRTCTCMPPGMPGGRDANDSRERPRRNDVALILSSFAMGCYFLASVTVVKMTLPAEYRTAFSEASGVGFSFNTKVLNMMFSGSACVSAMALASLLGIQRGSSKRHQLETQILPSLSSQLP